MKTIHEELARCPDVNDNFVRSPSAEDRAREALDWAIGETCLRIPPSLRNPYSWEWNADDVSLRNMADDGEFDFHIAGERRGSRKVRIAVLTVMDDHGKATWEADIPEAE